MVRIINGYRGGEEGRRGRRRATLAAGGRRGTCAGVKRSMDVPYLFCCVYISHVFQMEMICRSC